MIVTANAHGADSLYVASQMNKNRPTRGGFCLESKEQRSESNEFTYTARKYLFSMLCYLCSKKPRQLGGAKINYVRLLEQEPTEFIFRKLSEHARWRCLVVS